MSANQHGQANRHHKYSTRGERKLAKLGIRLTRTPLWKLRKQLVRRAT